jgi:chromodomain-helicase-DNA-binding protein 4
MVLTCCLLVAWDTPPLPGEYGRVAFEKAFERFVNSRHVIVPVIDKKKANERDNRPKDGFRRNLLLKDGEQPDLGQDSQLKLMPFQVVKVFEICIPNLQCF